MPVYRDPLHGVEQSEALAEAAAIAPIHRVMLNTFELYHPIGTPDGPIYVVNDNDPLLATKEATADRDPSVEVEFMAAEVKIVRPEENDQEATPEMELSVSNVSGDMAQAVRTTRNSGSRVPWELIERVYASDDTSAPAIMPPLKVICTAVGITEEGITLKVSWGDPANVSVPRVTFKRSEYPGLVR